MRSNTSALAKPNKKKTRVVFIADTSRIISLQWNILIWGQLNIRVQKQS